MRIDRRLLNWGVFFILLGGIPLAVQQHWIPDDIRWWELWPLLLIGLGVGVLLRRTTAAPFGGVIVAATFGLMIGGALANGFGGFPTVGFGCVGGTSAGTPFPTQDGAFTGDRAVVRLETGCGDLNVTTETGSAWSLSGTASHGRLPDIERSASVLTVRDTGQDFFRDRSVWNVTLPTAPTLDLTASVNAGSGRLVLGGAQLDGVTVSVNAGDGRVDLGSAVASRLSLDVNAGSAKVTLPDASLTGTLTANAGSIEFCTPPTVALRLHTNDNITASDNYGDAGLTEVSDNVWESPDWATATKRIELTTTANAASFTLNPKDGCQ
jgi:hypothetical protein